MKIIKIVGAMLSVVFVLFLIVVGVIDEVNPTQVGWIDERGNVYSEDYSQEVLSRISWEKRADVEAATVDSCLFLGIADDGCAFAEHFGLRSGFKILGPKNWGEDFVYRWCNPRDVSIKTHEDVEWVLVRS